MKEEFVTTDFAEAKAAFDKEVEQLSLEYKKSEQLNYSPTDDEMRHAITCTLVSIEDDEIEYLDESDYFFQE